MPSGSAEPVSHLADRLAAVHRAVPISRNLSRAPAEVGSRAPNAVRSAGGWFAPIVSRAVAGRACGSAVEVCLRGPMFLAAVSALLAAAATAEAPAIARPRSRGSDLRRRCARRRVLPRERARARHGGGRHRAHVRARRARARAARRARVAGLARAGRGLRSLRRRAGRPFSDADGTLREDYVVLLLASTPRGVRALAADARPLVAGARVRVLGPGSPGQRDEQDASGTITSPPRSGSRSSSTPPPRSRAGAARPCSRRDRSRDRNRRGGRAGRRGTRACSRRRSAACSMRCASRSTAARAARFAAFAPTAPRRRPRSRPAPAAAPRSALIQPDRGKGHGPRARDRVPARWRGGVDRPCAARSSPGARRPRTARRAAST